MPRYHLNVYNDIVTPDEEGIERDSVAEATMEAINGARGLVAASILQGDPVYEKHRIDITDQSGKLLHTVRFGDIVDLRS
jgi:hypothetical protein